MESHVKNSHKQEKTKTPEGQITRHTPPPIKAKNLGELQKESCKKKFSKFLDQIESSKKEEYRQEFNGLLDGGEEPKTLEAFFNYLDRRSNVKKYFQHEKVQDSSRFFKAYQVFKKHSGEFTPKTERDEFRSSLMDNLLTYSAGVPEEIQRVKIEGVEDCAADILGNLSIVDTLEKVIPHATKINPLQSTTPLLYLHSKFNLNTEEGIKQLRERYSELVAAFGDDNVGCAFNRYPEAFSMVIANPQDIGNKGYGGDRLGLMDKLIPPPRDMESQIKARLFMLYVPQHSWGDYRSSKKVCGSCGREGTYNYCSCRSPIKDTPRITENAIKVLKKTNTLCSNLASVIPGIDERIESDDLAYVLLYLHSAFNLETEEGREKIRQRYDELSSSYGGEGVVKAFQRNSQDFSRFFINPENISKTHEWRRLNDAARVLMEPQLHENTVSRLEKAHRGLEFYGSLLRTKSTSGLELSELDSILDGFENSGLETGRRNGLTPC